MSGLEDPISALREAAAQLHELYAEYVRAGFTPPQALYLVGLLLRPQPPSAP